MNTTDSFGDALSSLDSIKKALAKTSETLSQLASSCHVNGIENISHALESIPKYSFPNLKISECNYNFSSLFSQTNPSELILQQYKDALTDWNTSAFRTVTEQLEEIKKACGSFSSETLLSNAANALMAYDFSSEAFLSSAANALKAYQSPSIVEKIKYAIDNISTYDPAVYDLATSVSVGSNELFSVGAKSPI